ncbi:hypothetical protein CesoFtcFv8_025134 [Champsocephalus esox]|uniref:BHLH domain-containing protein n=1 Tax=Champsocephalus esox TaxID=159716 RepID=A0AAN8B367_9TELE|nr:hypothetical protein CesoFtcFv8_025134 [Champsocephalus esox]
MSVLTDSEGDRGGLRRSRCPGEERSAAELRGVRALRPARDPALMPGCRAPRGVLMVPAVSQGVLMGVPMVSRGGPGGARGRPAAANAARERSRVQTLRSAFLELQRTLPSVPRDTKLSKLDVLILATTYIAHLTRTLHEEGAEQSARQTEALTSLKGDGYLHPVKVGVTP